MRRPALLATLGLIGSMSCSGTTSFVKFDKQPEVTLGRVVVYRNGIAYFERRAHVVGDRLTMHVPVDKLDDFLKSLTVNDASTGQALPVSFPTRRASVAGEVEMLVQAGGGVEGRQVVLTYVTEAPAWKPSYRVIMGQQGRVDLEGWAIVDNTSGEDWRAVKVGVGSSSALSFRFDLHSLRMVQRETLQSQERFAMAPPRGGSLVAEGPRQEIVLDQLADREIPRQAGHPEFAARVATGRGDDTLDGLKDKAGWGRGAGGGAGLAGLRGRGGERSKSNNYPPAARHSKMKRPAADAPLASDESRVRALAQSLRHRRGTILLEGYAGPSENEPGTRALDRANLLRNQLILNGVAPAQIKVEARGLVAGQPAGVRIVEQPPAPVEQQQPKSARKDDGSPVGESHFESGKAMTVKRGTSAMVAIVQGKASGEVVYLYDPESTSGSDRFAFKSIRFRNPTRSTLESGPVTVYGDGRFIGEGLTEAIPPMASAVVPFALDRQVVIDSSGSDGDRISKLIKLHRGVLTAEVQHLRHTKLKIMNRLSTPATVLIRHSVPKGWKLLRGPKTAELLGDAQLFEVKLDGGKHAVVELEEATPMVRILDLRSPVGLDLVRVYLQTPRVDAEFALAMDRLLKLHAEMVGHEEAIENLRQRGDEYRQRNDELHAQIFSLKAVKAKGTLMAHLEAKMKEISQRLQQNTIAIVDHQEKVMVAKVKFQEGLADLTLEKKTEKRAASK
jgi:hypothetical protein